MRRYEISRCGQDDRIGVVGRKAGGNEAIVHLHVVAARATQAADRPGIDDVALRGRAEHEPVLWRPCRRRSGLSILVHRAQEDEPGAQLTPAHQGPAPAHAIATIDDGGASAWSCTVRQDHVRVAKDELRDVPGEPGRGPVNIAVPDAPRDRCVGARELLVDIDRLDRTQVETAIGGGQEDTEESGSCQLVCEIVGQAPVRLDAIALGQNARPKCLGTLQDLGGVVTISHCGPPCDYCLRANSPVKTAPFRFCMATSCRMCRPSTSCRVSTPLENIESSYATLPSRSCSCRVPSTGRSNRVKRI